MKPIEHSAKPASPSKTGPSATLCSPFRVQGSSAPATRGRRRGVASLAMLCASLIACALAATTASAALTHPYKSQITGTPSGHFGSVCAVAVDPGTQDIYVSDPAHDAIDVFNSSGTYQSQISGVGVPAGEFSSVACSVAVDDVTHDVYVADSGPDLVYEFDSAGKYLGTLSAAETPSHSERFGGGYDGVAVDQSTGDIYVSDPSDHVVDKFDSAGHFLFDIPDPELQQGLAVDSSGNVYASNGDAIIEFNSSGTQVNEISGQPVHFYGNPLAATSDLFVAASGLVEEKELSGVALSLTSGSNTPGDFFSPEGVAAGSTGSLYVADSAHAVIDVFGPAAILPDSTTGEASEILPSAATLNGQVDPAGGGGITDCHFELLTDAAYRANGDNFTTGATDIPCEQFTPISSATAVSAKLTGLAPNTMYDTRLVATNANGEEHGSDEAFQTTGPPTTSEASAAEITKTTATLQAQINPHGFATKYRFQYVDEEHFKAGGFANPATIETPESALVGEDFSNHPASAAIAGLELETTYHFRVIATSECEPSKECTTDGEDATFIAEPALRIDATFATDISSSSATLGAQIDPLGEPATYHFEYLTEGEYQENLQAGPDGFSGPKAPTRIPVPDAAIARSEADQAVAQHLQGLAASTTYRYRVTAVSEYTGTQTFDGPTQTFSTERGGESLTLLDGRQWELVSPADKHGALLEGLGFYEAEQASVGGGAMSYFAEGATESAPQGQAEGAQVLSTHGPGGWSSQDIATPHEKAVGGVTTGRGAGEYFLFSEDLSRALVEPRDPVKPFFPLRACSATGCVPESFPEATEFTAYVRHDSTCVSEVASCYEPLLTGAAGYADVRPGAEFGDRNGFVGAAPDLNSVVVASAVGLTPGAPQRKELYEWSAGAPAAARLQLVSVLPESEGGGPVIGTEDVELGLGGANQLTAGGWRPVSVDGSRVFWTLGELSGPHQLYMRDMAKGETLRIGMPGGSQAAFQAASSDGSKVFFKTGGGDLYVCEVVEEAGKDACRLSDLSAVLNSGEAAGVQELVPGTSDDGSYVYFVAQGVLSSVENGEGEAAVPGGDNLYVSHYDGAVWTTTFIATLSATDENDWANGGSYLKLTIGELTARVSPSGRYLAFMSSRSLTGYDNRDAVTGRPDEEVYLYDAQTERVVCASCNPTGARPVGIEVSQFTSSGAGNGNYADVLEAEGFGDAYEETTGIAANLPGGVLLDDKHGSLYQPRYLSDSGRLFFNSSDALVPQDVNGGEDVYEYEPVGVGSCDSSSSTFHESADGCTSLISSGTSAKESAFLDASEGGDDVFFLTAAKLVSADTDTAYDVYDAHVCGSGWACVSEPALPPECVSADSCRAAPAPQPGIFGAPSSATLNGEGNVAVEPARPAAKPGARALTRAQKLARALKACRKKPKRARASCKAAARRRYGAKPKLKRAEKSSGRSR